MTEAEADRDRVYIENPQADAFVSAVLENFEQLSKSRGHQTIATRRPVVGEKGSIWTSIMIDAGVGLSVNVVWLMLQACVNRLRNRKDYNGASIVVINGDFVTVKAIEDSVNEHK
jgi:hypothetical protein